MNNMSRRSVIRGSLSLAATGALARPYIANSAKPHCRVQLTHPSHGFQEALTVGGSF